MSIDNEMLINQFGQGIVDIERLKQIFSTSNEKRQLLNDLIFLLIQSKPIANDINEAIIESGLRESYTPCIVLKKGLNQTNLEKIILLPDNELEKSFVLLLSLYRIAYQRRWLSERDKTSKWWYGNLADEEFVNQVRKNHS